MLQLVKTHKVVRLFRLTPQTYRLLGNLVLAAACILCCQHCDGADPSGLPAAAANDSAQDPMLKMLRKRVAEQPDHSDSWRLIGRVEKRLGNPEAALQAIAEALRLDPHNAAAHFDFGEILEESGQSERARSHFEQVMTIAPESKYATQLSSRGFTTAQTDSNPAGSGVNVSQVGYEIQTFDGGDDLDRRMNQLRSDADPELKRLRIFAEFGALYNSNVSLTPISRELANEDAESYQGFLTPEFEWIARRTTHGRFGPLGRAFLTVNEAQQSQFDLASFQPGAFLERDLTVGNSELIGRLEYVYALDLLDGDRTGDRHSITGSVITIRPDLDVIYCYLTTSFTQFDNDGVDPAISSLDGTSVSGGISRFFQTEWSKVPTWSIGLDLENADTEGADFRYRAITMHTEATYKLTEKLNFLPEFGIGGRDYPDFTGTVNRDEVTWRVNGKLRWQCHKHFAISLVAGHDRFASDNDQFDAERTQGGIVSTILY